MNLRSIWKRGVEVVELVNVAKVYDNDTVALVDVNLSIEPGEFVFLVGHSGAGKSTLLRLIYREEVPTRGAVMVGNVNVARLRRREIPFLRRGIGVVFQDFRLLPDRTVGDNVAFALWVTEASPRHIRRRVPEVLELVGLADKMHHRPHELSGGEQQRVALARALVNWPPLLLCDEPTGNLDPETAWGIMELLEDINDRGTTVLVATHAKSIVDAMGKRVIALRDGRVVRDQERGIYSDAT